MRPGACADPIASLAEALLARRKHRHGSGSREDGCTCRRLTRAL